MSTPLKMKTKLPMGTLYLFNINDISFRIVMLRLRPYLIVFSWFFDMWSSLIAQPAPINLHLDAIVLTKIHFKSRRISFPIHLWRQFFFLFTVKAWILSFESVANVIKRSKEEITSNYVDRQLICQLGGMSKQLFRFVEMLKVWFFLGFFLSIRNE